jgi:heme exporter protein A
MESGGNSIKSVTVSVENVSRQFNRRSVFKGISFSLASPASMAVTGKNGAGKSTLVKIVAGVLGPTRGAVSYSIDGRGVTPEEFKCHIGFVSPYLNLYDEFTALENLEILSRIRLVRFYDDRRARHLLESLALWERRDDSVGTFSSGMKQLVKYAFALLHRPELLILDEPNANLDADGIAVVKQAVHEQKKNHILMVATNDKEEAAWCEREIRIGG